MKAFFDAIRDEMGPFNQSQVDGFNTIIALTDGLLIVHQAYMLATVWHECARTMQPITEFGKASYFDKYDAGTPIGKQLGNTIKGDGARFKGRGYVQLTGRANYVRAAKVVGEDIVARPELALRPDIAAQIMVHGMTNGWFTTRKLSDFSDYRNMRRVINGVDKAATIAGYAKSFEMALLARDKEGVEPAPATVEPKPAETQPAKPATPANGLPKLIGGLIAMAIAAIAAWLGFGGE